MSRSTDVTINTEIVLVFMVWRSECVTVRGCVTVKGKRGARGALEGRMTMMSVTVSVTSLFSFSAQSAQSAPPLSPLLRNFSCTPCMRFIRS